MSQGHGKTTAAYFDPIIVARLPHTIIQDLFKSGLNSVHEQTYLRLITLSAFATFVALQSDFSFKKAQHKPGLMNTGEWGKCCIQAFCPEVFLV